MERILITGGNGFLGKELAKVLSNDGQVFLGSRNNKNNRLATLQTNYPCIPLDITNIESVRDVFRYVKPTIVIHAAATKFVDLSEEFPFETIDVNIIGSENISRVSMENKINLVIGISTDKAAPPCRNIYAISKALMERLFCRCNDTTSTNFLCVRYGNVAWSTGSVLTVWKEMIKDKNLITTCGQEMYRYMFTVKDAAKFVQRALKNQKLLAGKVISMDMKSLQIKDMLKVVKQISGCETKSIEQREGERMTEFLVGQEELSMTEIIYLDKLRHYSIDFKRHDLKELDKPVSAETSPKLTDYEIQNIVNGII
tara:strand:+ start:38 stop:976 length:939 start_codon:yes stop_codon:yes gene_type:complete